MRSVLVLTKKYGSLFNLKIKRKILLLYSPYCFNKMYRLLSSFLRHFDRCHFRTLSFVRLVYMFVDDIVTGFV